MVIVLLTHEPCTNAPRRSRPSDTPINAVLADHDDKLLAIAGVVGVYLGLMEDGRTPCRKVMVVRKSPELEKRIPRASGGHSVVMEVTGQIRPLK